MHPRAPVLVAILLSAGLGAGCFGDGGGEGATGPRGATPRPGVHPWPAADGSEWPVVAGVPLAGPFEQRPPERTFVPSADGTELNVWVIRPDLPPGVKAPVVLWSSPYWGQQQAAGDDPALWDNDNAADAVPVNLLVENGFAVAIMNLRGSGLSGGCFTFFGSEDWDDNAAVVEWLGTQEWSNGRVGMMGLSYHGTTPWQAAVRQPSHLKTIVTAGMIHNVYTFFYTDQGAAQAAGPSFSTLVYGVVGAFPAFEVQSAPERVAQEFPTRVPERACAETPAVATEVYSSSYTDDRSKEFWEERRIIRDFPNITASVLLTHGLRDLTGHAIQEDPVWQALDPDLPKRMIVGQWGHMFPNFADAWTDTREDWDGVHLAWFDYWLKGLGAPVGVGTVDYQADDRTWRTSTSWPPAEAQAEVLHLCGGALAAAPCTGPQGSYLSAQGGTQGEDTLCGNDPAPPQAAQGTSLVFLTDPLESDVVLAGNPFGLIELESSLPGGLFSVELYETDATGGCGDGFRLLSFGAADLRHHAGNYDGRDFPVDDATPLRLDLTNLAERIAAGHRLAVVAHHGDATRYEAVPFAPMLTVHGGSHLVFPVVEGTLGGAPPSMEYPPRPFVALAA